MQNNNSNRWLAINGDFSIKKETKVLLTFAKRAIIFIILKIKSELIKSEK